MFERPELQEYSAPRAFQNGLPTVIAGIGAGDDNVRVLRPGGDMTYRTVRMSPAIQIVTACMLAATIGFLIASLYARPMWIVASALALISAACYATAPVGYELSGDRLTVLTHIGSREFGPITGCSRVETSIMWGLRLFGNGGLFAGTG